MLLTNKKFEERMKLRNVYCVALIFLGIISAVLGTVGVNVAEKHDFSSGFYTGVGFALIASAIITLIKNKRLMNDPEKRKEREIFEDDERNKMIGLKTWSYAGYTMFVILYIAMLIFGFFNTVIMMTLMVTIGVFALCILIFTKILKKTI